MTWRDFIAFAIGVATGIGMVFLAALDVIRAEVAKRLRAKGIEP